MVRRWHAGRNVSTPTQQAECWTRPVLLVCVEPPAGIEPATPSLPSMVGPFGGQCGTSLRSIELQVAGLIDDREMGCCEAVCGTAAGKSLARSPVGCSVVARREGFEPNRQIRSLVLYVHPVRLSAVGAAQVRGRIHLDRLSPVW